MFYCPQVVKSKQLKLTGVILEGQKWRHWYMFKQEDFLILRLEFVWNGYRSSAISKVVQNAKAIS